MAKSSLSRGAYLRFAEACNQAGYSSLAFTALKYGLSANAVSGNVAPSERYSGVRFVDFSNEAFDKNMPLHGRGSGNSALNSRYSLSVGDSVWIYDTAGDSLAFVEATPEHRALVKDSLDLMILDEMALETAFEGTRFQDLMRFALRNGNNELLASRIAGRGKEFDNDLYLLLLDEKNWYLPKQ